jgi:hypothetical protein
VDAAWVGSCAGQTTICGLTCTNARGEFPHGMQRVCPRDDPRFVGPAMTPVPRGALRIRCLVRVGEHRFRPGVCVECVPRFGEGSCRCRSAARGRRSVNPSEYSFAGSNPAPATGTKRAADLRKRWPSPRTRYPLSVSEVAGIGHASRGPRSELTCGNADRSDLSVGVCVKYVPKFGPTPGRLGYEASRPAQTRGGGIQGDGSARRCRSSGRPPR